MLRIVMATYGSYGDLHPYIAVAIGLKARGHSVVLATSEYYRSKVEGEGIEFQPISPDIAQWEHDEEVRRKAMDIRTGTEFVVRKMFLPALEASYEELLPVCRGADVLISHPLTFAVPIIAEQLGQRWLATVLQPSSFFSRYEPPGLSGFSALLLGSALMKFADRLTRSWMKPVFELRESAGLKTTVRNPLMRGWSPFGNMAWFSRVLGKPQADWPPCTVQTGFLFYDKEAAGASVLSEGMQRFLEEGDAPVVFTLGTAAALMPGDFFEQSLEAIEDLGMRAMMISPAAEELGQRVRSKQVFVARYAPYSQLFPRARINVHQGGVGTTAQALRAGRPMVVVPYSHDQPDNAIRVTRLGVARWIFRGRYSRKRVVRAIRELVADRSAEQKAREIAAAIASEDGVTNACAFIEASVQDGRCGKLAEPHA